MSTSKLCRRIIPCLDVDGGRVVKGVKFQGLRDVGDPVELALRYQNEGADELVFLDIGASHENRDTMADTVSQVAEALMIPFTVGGGVRVLADARRLLEAGADKVSVNTAAVNNPELMDAIAAKYGAQCCVLAIDARWNAALNDWEVITHGGRTQTGKTVLRWAQEGVARGAGEILLTSWDRDGTREGFDLPLTGQLANALGVPVIASGGACDPQSFVEVFAEPCKADAALAAGIFHDGHVTIAEVKSALAAAGIPVRQS